MGEYNMKGSTHNKLRRLIETIVREETDELETMALNLLDSIEGNLNDTPGIDAFFRKNNITNRDMKRKILDLASKLKQ